MIAGALFAPSAAAASPSPVPAKAAAVKPAPTPEVSQTLVPKPAHQAAAARSTAAWAVSLGASAGNPRAGQAVTFTATANQSVSNTGLWISIYENANADGPAVLLAACGGGTVCSSQPVVHNKAISITYKAYISAPPGSTPPPPGVVAESNPGPPPGGGWAFSVTWNYGTPTVSADQTTQALGGTATVTAATDFNVSPTPVYIQLYDSTTGVRLASCGGGSTCAATVSQAAATTHRYVSYVSSADTAYPPAGAAGNSRGTYITWSTGSWHVSLKLTSVTSGHALVTATVDQQYKQSPYYLTFYDETTGAHFGTCYGELSCARDYFTGKNSVGADIVAFISSDVPTMPPPDAQAASNALSVDIPPIIS